MKSMNWFARLLLRTIFICGITVFTTWYIMNSYISNLMVQMNLQDSYKQLSLMDLITQLQPQSAKKTPDSSKQAAATIKNDPNAAKMTGSVGGTNGGNVENNGGVTGSTGSTGSTGFSGGEGGTGTTGNAGVTGTTGTAGANGAAGSNGTAGATGTTGNAGSTGVNGSTDSSKSPNSADNTDKQYDAVSVWSQLKSGTTQNGADNNKMMISSEDVLKKKDLMSNQDRMTIFSILVAKLPQQELQTISQYMEDGITVTEWQEMQAILNKYLSEAENKQLMTIINKY